MSTENNRRPTTPHRDYQYRNDKIRIEPVNDSSTRWVRSRWRWPSWCDHVLYLQMPHWMINSVSGGIVRDPNKATDCILFTSYRSLTAVKWSDHRPVVSNARIPFKPIGPPPENSDFSMDGRWSPVYLPNPGGVERRKKKAR